MKYLLIFIFIFFCFPVFAKTKCELPITSSILKLRKDISCEEAYSMATSIYFYCKRHALNWKDLVAIAYKESTLCKYKEGKNKDGHTIDYGCYQINVTNIWRMKLNPDRLMNDFNYNVKVATDIVRYLRAVYGIKYPNAWLGLYKTGINVADPSVIKEATEYFNDVKEIKKKIDESKVKKESRRP